ncbi:alpha-methylacyl-CoA racemase [Xylariomycetidae sp. FL2044]|nr:alpha-methylacyl-CoA racemase [Xylariomycetidae sp. FL2044]
MAGQTPLQGLKVLEFAGLAPGPFAGLLLADAGAKVLRIDRAVPGQTHTPGVPAPLTPDMLARHKSSIAVDLKSPSGTALIRQLSKTADVLIDPFRPGVLEKLGLGPEVLCGLNPRLIYGRMTGFRRDGRYADMAGHDINYLAVSGVLSLLGRSGKRPHPPWNILADFAGGGATLFQGVLLAVVARHTTGRGQVVEANMVDGASYLATFPRMALKTPLGAFPRGENQLDGGCPFYDTYETRDGKYVAVGALESQLNLDPGHWSEARRTDRAHWPELRRLFAAAFASRTRDEWESVFDGQDACVTPVLTYAELERHDDDDDKDPTNENNNENRNCREGDQRPPVTLRDTPLLAVAAASPQDHQKGAAAASRGQGPGVSGQGYMPTLCGAGEGGEEALGGWFGMVKGREFGIEKGGLVFLGDGDGSSVAAKL